MDLAIPVGLWLLWFVLYGNQTGNVHSRNLSAIPRYVFDAATAAVSAATAVDLSWSRLLVIALAAGVGVRLARGGWREPRLWSSLAIVIAYWVSLALGRADELGGEPTASRLKPF